MIETEKDSIMETTINSSDNIITRSYEEYHQVILNYITYRITHRYEAEDLTQETFLQAYKSLYKFRGECEVFTWLAAIGKHTYFKYLKKKRLHLDAANLDLVAQNYLKGDVSPEEHVSQKDIEKGVRKVVEDIPNKYRDVLDLRVYAELPFSQVAQILRISENSAKVIYFRAKKMLMEVLKDELEM